MKILPPKQMLQRLLLRLMPVETVNIWEYLLNEIYLIVYSLYRTEEITKTGQFNIFYIMLSSLSIYYDSKNWYKTIYSR